MSEPTVLCETTKGSIDIVVENEWSPRGAERFLELVKEGFFKDVPLFRCVDEFLCQFGYKEPTPGEKRWSTIKDDPKGQATPKKFKRGYISFAGGGKNTRDNHLFVTLGENVSSLGREFWETPIGYVTPESMESVVSQWTTKYGDMAPWGTGPDPGKIARKGGNEYLKQSFPDLDYILSCHMIVKRQAEQPNDIVEVKNTRIVLELAPNLGRVVIDLRPEWSPLGAKRLLEMLNVHFLDEARFFRVVPGFVVQFGMPADPKRGKEFPTIKDDPVKESNTRGMLTFATSGPDSRTTQLFINLGDNARLDDMGFSPIGLVVEGMNYVDMINSEYRERPNQGWISQEGNDYLNKNFPNLSYIRRAYIPGSDAAADPLAPNDIQPKVAIMDPPRRENGIEFIYSLVMVLATVLGFFYIIRLCFGQSGVKSR